MKSPKCIHRVIPAPCKLPRRKQALAPVGAVDDHRAVFRNLRLHFIQPLIRQVHSPQEMSCLIFPLLPHIQQGECPLPVQKILQLLHRNRPKHIPSPETYP